MDNIIDMQKWQEDKEKKIDINQLVGLLMNSTPSEQTSLINYMNFLVRIRNNNALNNRIDEIALLLNLTNEEFGYKIGFTSATVPEMENKINDSSELIERYIKIICATFNVNEIWLTTGEGEIFVDNIK